MSRCKLTWGTGILSGRIQCWLSQGMKLSPVLLFDSVLLVLNVFPLTRIREYLFEYFFFSPLMDLFIRQLEEITGNGVWERGGITCSKQLQVWLEPWALQRGRSLCTWDTRSTDWATETPNNLLSIWTRSEITELSCLCLCVSEEQQSGGGRTRQLLLAGSVSVSLLLSPSGVRLLHWLTHGGS